VPSSVGKKFLLKRKLGRRQEKGVKTPQGRTEAKQKHRSTRQYVSSGKKSPRYFGEKREGTSRKIGVKAKTRGSVRPTAQNGSQKSKKEKTSQDGRAKKENRDGKKEGTRSHEIRNMGRAN